MLKEKEVLRFGCRQMLKCIFTYVYVCVWGDRYWGGDGGVGGKGRGWGGEAEKEGGKEGKKRRGGRERRRGGGGLERGGIKQYWWN